MKRLIFAGLLCVQMLCLRGQEMPVPRGCTQIEADNEENLYLLDTDNNRILKLLAATGYDSLIVTGGKTGREEGLLHPVKMSLFSRQGLLVLDDAQRKILLLNTNFKVMGQTDFLASREDGSEIIPQTFDANPAGEKYILNQLDNRIIKINLFNEEEMQFSGLDAGEGSLYRPADLEAGADNLIYVSDTSRQEIAVFDNFGTFRYRFHPDCNFRWKRMRLFESTLALFDADHLYLVRIQDKAGQAFPLPEGFRLTDVTATRTRLYLLTENAVHLYSRNP